MKGYRAYIAANAHTPAFDSEINQSKMRAVKILKSRNSPDWKDCTVWVVAILNNNEEFKVTFND